MWLAAAASFAVWVSAVVLIFRSAKFRRKWLWLLLSLFTFSFGWSPELGLRLTAALPLGALWVIWFWRFGPAPVVTTVAPDSAPQGIRPSGGRLVRSAYALALLPVLAVAWVAMSGALMEAFLASAGLQGSPDLRAFMAVAKSAAVVPLGALFVALAYLARRPYWWGKLLLGWAGLSWAGFGAAGLVLGLPIPLVVVVLASGLTMLGVLVVHQIVDPRMSGAPVV
jgi:hypothetical protein